MQEFDAEKEQLTGKMDEIQANFELEISQVKARCESAEAKNLKKKDKVQLLKSQNLSEMTSREEEVSKRV